MPSSPKIPKEQILDTALKMLIRDGYAAINIKAVAQELNCSTQPISRCFGSMDGFRQELVRVAAEYVRRKMYPAEGNTYDDVREWGRVYLDIAIDEPHLFQFICMGASGRLEKNGMWSWKDYAQNMKIMEEMMKKYNLTSEKAAEFMQTAIIYIHGMACLVASSLVIENRETVYQMLDDFCRNYLTALQLPCISSADSASYR